MPRKPDGAEARRERITVRLTTAGRDVLRQQLRDGESEGDFVRTAVRAEVERRAAARAAEDVRAAVNARRAQR